MIVEITVEGINRTYQGEFHEMYNRDWNVRIQGMLDIVETDPVKEIPQMEGTMDALDKLKI